MPYDVIFLLATEQKRTVNIQKIKHRVSIHFTGENQATTKVSEAKESHKRTNPLTCEQPAPAP